MATDKGPEVREWDDEWLVRRGNYLTLVTPEVAVELLKRNTNNRRPKKRAIASYASDMRAGKWDPDASDIKVARTGELLDGQNRLMACVEANVPFPTLLRTGLALTAKQNVDQGVRRTVADQLQMEGNPYPVPVAAAIDLRSRYEYRLSSFGGRQTSDSKANLTMQEKLEYLHKHPLVTTLAAEGIRMGRITPSIPPSVWVAGLSMAGESNEKEAMRFADNYVTGESPGTGDPLLALTRYAAHHAKMPVGSPGARGRASAVRHLLAFITAWNAWRQDERLERIVIRDTDLLVPAQ